MHEGPGHISVRLRAGIRDSVTHQLTFSAPSGPAQRFSGVIVLPLVTVVAAPLMEDFGLLPRATHGAVEEERGQATPSK